MPRSADSPTPARSDGYPPAPLALPARQRALWHGIVRSKPPAWWDSGCLPLLRCLVGHVETCERVEAELCKVADLGEPAALAQLEMLSRLRDRESRAVATLAAKLRLTPQSRYTPASASTAARRAGAPAWDTPPPNPFERYMLRVRQ